MLSICQLWLAMTPSRMKPQKTRDRFVPGQLLRARSDAFLSWRKLKVGREAWWRIKLVAYREQ